MLWLNSVSTGSKKGSELLTAETGIVAAGGIVAHAARVSNGHIFTLAGSAKWDRVRIVSPEMVDDRVDDGVGSDLLRTTERQRSAWSAREIRERTSQPYLPLPHWAQIPHGMRFNGDATSVAVDSEDRVYVFNRGEVPMVIFERSGDFVGSWGVGEFDWPHAIWIDEDDNLFLVDTGGHFVQKRTREGRVLFTIGTRGEPAEVQSGRFFNRPTDVVTHPKTRDVYISDGYGNSRVHQFDGNGRHIASWGESGTDDGQFSLPHGVALIDDDRLVVCDRENFRLQLFSTEGEYIEQWHMHHPSAVRQGAPYGHLFVAELGTAIQHGVPNVGCRVSVHDVSGNLIGRLGAPTPGFAPNQMFAPHGLAIDSHGDVYVAEVNRTYLTAVLGMTPPKGEPVSLRKWQRVA